VTSTVSLPARIADAHADAGRQLANEALLRCWVRERAVPRPDTDTLVLWFDDVQVSALVLYWSATGLHRFGPPSRFPSRSGRHPDGSGAQVQVDEFLRPEDLAVLMTGNTNPGPGASADPALGASADPAPESSAPISAAQSLASRAAESASRIALHLEVRSSEPAPAVGGSAFLTAEQGLLAGHPFHPAAKSRDGLGAHDTIRFSPELRGSFQLDWFCADPELVAHDSSLGPSAPDLSAFLSSQTPDGGTLVPAHPWQARDLLNRPGVRGLIAAGRLRHLGPLGPEWHPTSSLRTVYRPDRPVMLKLSLGLNITNSKREHLRKELLRGVEAHRLFAGELGARLLAGQPAFRMLTDAAYLAVDGAPGLEVSFRHAPFQPSDYVFCIASLLDLGRGSLRAAAGPPTGSSAADPASSPGAGVPDGYPHELAAHIAAIAISEGRAISAVAADWFARYVINLITPLLWLDAEYGVTLEGHQQNTLVQLDAEGYPVTGWYRDNQGFYYRRSRIAELRALGRDDRLGVDSDSVVEDAVVTERLLYYVGVNNLFGMIGALGGCGAAAETELLGIARTLLAPLGGHEPVDLLLGALKLRCKANLATRAAGLDELVGSLADQSVYVEIDNPFARLPQAGSHRGPSQDPRFAAEV
jgi:siderophore synthetase component